MLSTPKRPRAPSASALRVLYQLAYITSGTALGVGVLCAEERRRRCKLVQKVADNARRLHSNPRYCRNAVVDQIDWTDDSNVNFLLTRAALKNPGGVRAAGLPSVVDESYEQITKKDEVRPKRRRRKRNDPSMEQLCETNHAMQPAKSRIKPPGLVDASVSTTGRKLSSAIPARPSFLPRSSPRPSAISDDPGVTDHNNSESRVTQATSVSSGSAFGFLQDLGPSSEPTSLHVLSAGSAKFHEVSQQATSRRDIQIERKHQGMPGDETTKPRAYIRFTNKLPGSRQESQRESPAGSDQKLAVGHGNILPQLDLESDKTRPSEHDQIPLEISPESSEHDSSKPAESFPQLRPEIEKPESSKHDDATLQISPVHEKAETAKQCTSKKQSRFSHISVWARSQRMSQKRAYRPLKTAQSSPRKFWLPKHVASFLKIVAEEFLQQDELKHASDVANMLLRIACENGVFECVKDLVSWKITAASVTRADLELLAEFWQTLTERADGQEHTDLLADLFKAYRAQQVEEIVTMAQSHESAVTPPTTIFDKSHESMLARSRPLLLMLSPTDCPQVIRQECAALLEAGDWNMAIRLIISSTHVNASLARCLFSAALDSDNLDLCVPILEWTGGSLEHEVISRTQIEKFVDRATKSTKYRPIRLLFSMKATKDAAENHLLQRPAHQAFFSQRCLVNICIAYAHQSDHGRKNQTIFKIAFDALSAQYRCQVRRDCPEEYIMMLLHDWKYSENFEHFMAEYRLAIAQWRKEGESVAMRRLQMIAVKICSASRPELAREVFQGMDSGYDVQSKLLAVGISLSNQKEWSVLESLINAAAECPASLEHDDDHRIMNDIMSEYSRHHKCEETERFVSSMLQAFEQSLSRAVYMILLRAAISEKRLDLLQEWSQAYSRADANVQFDSIVVWQLLAHYRQVHKVDVGLLMWISNIIRKYIPWLDSKEGGILRGTAYAEMMLRSKQKFGTKRQQHNIKDTVQKITSPESDTVRSIDTAPRYQALDVEAPPGRLTRTDTGATIQLPIPSELLLDIPLEPDSIESDKVSKIIVSENTDSQLEQDTPTSPVPNSLEPDQPHSPVALENVDDQLDQDVSTSLISVMPTDTDVSGIGSRTITETVAPKLKTNMRNKLIAEMALRNYSAVIELYTNSIGYESDNFALRMAVQASIELHSGDTQHAEVMLETADKHRIDTSDAEVAIKIARLRNFDRGSGAAREVYKELLGELERSLHKARLLKEYVYVQAANLLIIMESPALAASLLARVEQALRDAGKSLSIIAVTVWLRALTEKADFLGAIQLTERVLESRISIDHQFRKVVWKAHLASSRNDDSTYAYRVGVANKLAALSDKCLTRLEQQNADGSRFAWDLVRTIITIADPENASWTLNDMAATADPTHLVFRSAKSMKGFSGLTLPGSSEQHNEATNDDSLLLKVDIPRSEATTAMQRLLLAGRTAAENKPDTRDGDLNSYLEKESDIHENQKAIKPVASKKEGTSQAYEKPILSDATLPDLKPHTKHQSFQNKRLIEGQKHNEIEKMANVLLPDARQTLVSAAG